MFGFGLVLGQVLEEDFADFLPHVRHEERFCFSRADFQCAVVIAPLVRFLVGLDPA